jgi:hypothetical protein
MDRMLDGSPGVRARNSLLGAAVGDVFGGFGLQPVLFAPTLRLSEAGWAPLATCEAMARAGGRPTPEGVELVRHEWRDAGRPGPGGAAGSGTSPPELEASLVALRAAPLAFMPYAEAPGDARLLLGLSTPLADGGAGVSALMRALQACLEAPSVPASLPSFAVAACDPLVAEALDLAATWPDDLPAALDAVPRGPGASLTGAMVGMLLGAAGAAIPWPLLQDIAEIDDVDRVAEAFAQLVSSAGVRS